MTRAVDLHDISSEPSLFQFSPAVINYDFLGKPFKHDAWSTQETQATPVAHHSQTDELPQFFVQSRNLDTSSSSDRFRCSALWTMRHLTQRLRPPGYADRIAARRV
jgi:hypothetical protein